MKHPTLQKISLSTIALLGCFALGANAGPLRSTALASPNKQRPHMAATAKASGNRGGSQTQPSSTTLWYNGDFPGESNGNGLANEQDTSLGSGQFAHVYDNFVVPAGPGWDITSVFSNNLDNTGATGATYEIRQGVSAFNGGTIVASGMTTTPVVTPTGRSGFGFTEFTVEIQGLTIHLDPGTYWLNVTVIGDLTGRSFNSTTFGANCIGTPCGNDDNAFWDSNFFGVSFIPTTDPSVGCPDTNPCIDFSMGVRSGSPTPTPTPTPTPVEGQILWYNGDFDGSNGLANEENTSLGSGQFARVYDDFNVTGDGFDIGAVFSNNLENTNVTAASFEIRQGVSAFNGGTLIASGTTTTPEITPTGRSGFGFTEFTIQISGLSLHLDPGTYWLAVWPTGDLTGRSFVSTTSGANCVGTPCANDDNSFFDSNFFGASFEPAGDFVSPPDFSMGVRAPVAGGALQLVSAASSQRGFAIDLPLTGPSGVEDRSGGPNKKYSIQMTFNNPIASVGSASSTCGGVSGISISGNTVTIKLVGVAHACNGSDIMITANDIMDTSGNSLSSATVTMGLLLGDVNADRVVDRADIQAVKADKGQHTDSTNFRSDVSNDGFIGSSDVMLVRQQQGTSLP